jgi:hypothetical protein
VEVDALKWRLAKLAPKKYGDRIEYVGEAGGTAIQLNVMLAGTIPRARVLRGEAVAASARAFFRRRMR